jgi:hypothetical protein
MSVEAEVTTQTIEREMLDRLAECYLHYGAEFLRDRPLPVVGSPDWGWVVGVLIREYRTLHPDVCEVAGYGS